MAFIVVTAGGMFVIWAPCYQIYICNLQTTGNYSFVKNSSQKIVCKSTALYIFYSLKQFVIHIHNFDNTVPCLYFSRGQLNNFVFIQIHLEYLSSKLFAFNSLKSCTTLRLPSFFGTINRGLLSVLYMYCSFNDMSGR